MDCTAKRALKSSFLLKASQQSLVDDVWGLHGYNNIPSDDFFVDDLFDFSDKDVKDSGFGGDEAKGSLMVSSQHRKSNSSSFSETDDFESLLAVPADELENLEWLSQFVDDSQSQMSLLCPSGTFVEKALIFPASRSDPAVQRIIVPFFSIPVPRKMRSKRSRPNGKAWSGSPSLTSDSSSISSSSSNGSSALSPFVWANPVMDIEMFSSIEKPPAKKQKKRPATDTGSGSNGSQTLRRCSHCLVQKTPQWRTGPLGPKTLCNACGVRFKSGRLFPEYRPACSPTFSHEIHSNSHRKVLEMRRKKETTDLVETGLAPMVSGF